MVYGLAGSENFVGELEEFILNAFINLEPVQRSEDWCDMRRFRSFNHSASKTEERRSRSKRREQGRKGGVASQLKTHTKVAQRTKALISHITIPVCIVVFRSGI